MAASTGAEADKAPPDEPNNAGEGPSTEKAEGEAPLRWVNLHNLYIFENGSVCRGYELVGEAGVAVVARLDEREAAAPADPGGDFEVILVF